MFPFKTRYKYWQVLVGFMCLGVLVAIMYYLTNETGSVGNHTKEAVDARKRPESSARMLHDFFYYVTFFYFALNYYYNHVAAGRNFYSYLKITAGLVLGAFAYKTILFYFFPVVLHNIHDSPLSVYRAMIGGMIPCLLFSFAFAYVTYLWESKNQRRILEAQKLQLEAQISQANFNFLKAQINPHFLHNTLNFLYAKSLPYSTELSEGILTLSDIMRYALGQGSLKDGKAPLEDEIEHVNNVIKISQLRYNNQLNVDFQIKGNIKGAHIIPFVLITIVENAFKHGDLKSQEDPITIKLDVSRDRLYFYCRNRKRHGPKQLSTGIGLDNIKKRLELAYGSNYRFEVTDAAEYYLTELTIFQL